MIDKKKLNFWRLTFIFSGFIMLSLFFLWPAPRAPKATMMKESMGNMAKNMHLSNATIYDLFGQPEMSNESSDMSNEHSNIPTNVKRMGTLTTIIIFGLLPFIIGGSIILAIVWIK